MKKSTAILKAEQRAKNVAMGRTVRFERQVTEDEAKYLSKKLKEIRESA